MKRINILSKILITLVAIIATSCIDHYQVKTTVNKDGSLTRTISITGDSGCWDDARMNIPTDSLWNTSTTWKYETEGDTSTNKRYTLSTTRTFKNINELNEFLKPKNDTSGLMNIKAGLTKKFRWFYTFYSYEERFKKSFPFNHYPVGDFLSDKELRYFYDDNYTYSHKFDSLVFIEDLEQIPQLTPADSARIEELELKYMNDFAEWQAMNVFKEYLELLKLIKPEINLSQEEKDELLKNSKLVESYRLDWEDKGPNPLELIAETFNLSKEKIKKKHPVKSEIFYKKFDLANSDWFYNNNIYNQLELPGLLINTNADSISNSTSFWTYNENRFFAKDYVLQSESRTVNHWAFIITGLIIVALLVLLITGYVKK